MSGKNLDLWAACVLAAVYMAGMSVQAAQADTPDAEFGAAAAAYDAGDYDDAIARYETLLAAGWQAPELDYNLGNAYYRQGELGLAILHYKRALQLAPRDAQARHNLEFVLRAADAVQPTGTGWGRLLRRLRWGEWVVLVVVAWWMLMLQCARRVWRGQPIFRGPLIIVWLAVGVLALIGIGQQIDLERRPEYVITSVGQEALFAPLDSATAHFTLPAGSVVRIVDVANGWYRIRLDQKEGWVRQAAGETVR